MTGLWHGANYTFIIWGLIHGLFLVMNHLIAKPRKRLLKRLNIHNDNIILKIADSVATFFIVMFTWIFFRANNVGHAFNYIAQIFSLSLFTIPEILPKYTILIIALFFIVEWVGRDREYAIAVFGSKWPRIARWVMYYSIIIAILYFKSSEQQFIYFKF